MALLKNKDDVQPMAKEEAVDPNLTVALSPEEREAMLAYVHPDEQGWTDTPVTGELLGDRGTAEWTEGNQQLAERVNTQMADGMATYQAGTLMAMNGGPVRQSLEEAAAQAGFEGAELNFNSFPLIALQTEGLFSDTEGRPFNKGFDVRVLATKRKVVYRGLTSGKVEDTKKDIVYVYPNRNMATGVYEEGITSKGIPVKDALAELTARGLDLDRSEYIDIKAMMYAPDEEYHDEIFLLSIPPTSTGRFWGQYDTLVSRKRWKPAEVAENLCNHIMTVSCGAKVMKAKTPFYPWAFRFNSTENPL